MNSRVQKAFHNLESYSKQYEEKSYKLKDYYSVLKLNLDLLNEFSELKYIYHEDSYEDYEFSDDFIINLNNLKGVSNSKCAEFKFFNWKDFYDKFSFAILYQYYDYTFEKTYDFLKANSNKCTIPDEIPKILLYNGELFVQEGLNRVTLAKGLLLQDFYVKLYYNSKEELNQAENDGLIKKIK